MLPDVATPRLQIKVRAMIRPNKVSEIRSIGSSTRLKGISETADIKSNARWFDLQKSILRSIFATDQSFLHNVGVEYNIACRGTIASSDFMLDAIGSQWDRPDLIWPQWRFGSDQLALVPGCVASFGGESVFVRHDRTPRFVRVPSMRDDAQMMSAFRGLRLWAAVGPTQVRSE